jgi:hypothetical protein
MDATRALAVVAEDHHPPIGRDVADDERMVGAMDLAFPAGTIEAAHRDDLTAAGVGVVVLCWLLAFR